MLSNQSPPYSVTSCPPTNTLNFSNGLRLLPPGLQNSYNTVRIIYTSVSFYFVRLSGGGGGRRLDGVKGGEKGWKKEFRLGTCVDRGRAWAGGKRVDRVKECMDRGRGLTREEVGQGKRVDRRRAWTEDDSGPGKKVDSGRESGQGKRGDRGRVQTG